MGGGMKKENRGFLATMWRLFRKDIGWQSKLFKMGFGEDEIDLMDKTEDKWQAILVQHEENYHQNHWLKVTESIVEWMEEFDQEWLKERRLEFLDNETQKLEEKWQDICQLYWQMSKQDVPYWFRSLLLEDSLPKALAKKTFEKRLVRYGDQLKKGGLTE